jgi:hypothetical protein
VPVRFINYYASQSVKTFRQLEKKEWEKGEEDKEGDNKKEGKDKRKRIRNTKDGIFPHSKLFPAKKAHKILKN